MSRTMGTNGAPGLPGIQEIVKLAGLLRDTGDKVLSATSKLSLSTKLLADLNGAFSVIINETDDLESSFQVCNSSRNEVFRDIKFLHDFVQKTVGLKIQHNPNDTKVTVDITKFRHLKYLELQKVPLEMVKGIQGIRGQLECIVCSGGRGVGNIYELLAACGGDAGAGFVWGSLHRLALPYNALTHLDKSLEYAPWLETIDLSHNAIKKATELEYLPSLRNANLGFNNLESVPSFHKTAYHNLHKLILKNNYIDNIDGLQGLECLMELDLSYNCLTDHSMLWPLERMSMLIWVCLEGNPLSYHPRHRLHTIKRLHPSLSDSKFVLDDEPLNKSEKLFVSENRVFGMRSTMQRTSRRQGSGESSLASSFTQTYSETVGRTESPVRSRMTTSQSSDALERSIDVVTVGGSRSSGKKRRNVREAVIAEDDLDKERPKAKPNSLTNSYLEASMDHLETKRQILALRAKYGEDNWLSNQAAAHVQSILGIQQLQASPLGTSPLQQQLQSDLTSSPFSSTFTEAQQGLAVVESLNATASISPIPPPSGNAQIHYLKDAPLEAKQDKTEQRRIEREYESTDEGIVVETETDAENEELATATNEVQEILETSYDPDEEKGDLYLVLKKRGNESPDEILLIITPEDIKERDSITGKIKYRWATNTVLSCVLGRGTPTTVDITFDTTRKDRQARTYITELDEAKKIVETLNEMIIIQPMLLKVFKCMKCSTHFSQDADNSIVTSMSAGAPPKCPTCKSTLVIQSDELPTPTPERLEKIPEKGFKPAESQREILPVESSSSQLPHSSSQSSIGGTEGGAISITTSLVHFDSHPQAQICCSATSLEESRESTPSASINTKKYESDIEILSNPSQSSIEVLDDGSKSTTPHRKKSSEERRVAIAPSLLTIPDTTLVMAGLTESSSSGSLTDSVCTAYENKTLKLLDKTSEMSTSRSTSDAETVKGEIQESENSFAPVTNLTSMLGELLQSMKIGPSKDSMSKSEESSEFVGTSIQYSYTNFSDVDHRIKLHIILNVFEHENEDLAFLLRADILTQSSTETFPGCLVMSTAKVYILRINGLEGEDPQRWLHKESSWTIDRLRSFAPLPFKQGVLVELQQPNKPGESPTNNVVLCILQDFQRTSNFLFYLTDSPLPASCEVEFMVPQYCSDSIKNILKSSKIHKEEDSIRLLALFSSAVLTSPSETIKLKVSGLIVTSSSLVIIQDKCHWLLPGNNKLPSIITEQGMSNLIEVDFNETSLCLNLLDEVAGIEATWNLELVSAGAAEAVINSIRPPWEELFSVPLQINGPQVPASSGIIATTET
ncbi:serine/threonine-protein kinase 11-interacting protein isoform X1 [Nasonia vitripennis]|uniref:Serine/threonine-protein kinase 11-interacting protein n=1 Tax=Nasonia vitripennis TaxID=7425 RepID=A0A7M7LIW2_NASVI|nr:serine/threonine-protein kinase 11-interacting protein isoform X1 [Nasonia vitripennis]